MSEWGNWGECLKGKTCQDNIQIRLRKVADNSGSYNCKPDKIQEIRLCFLDNCL